MKAICNSTTPSGRSSLTHQRCERCHTKGCQRRVREELSLVSTSIPLPVWWRVSARVRWHS